MYVSILVKLYLSFRFFHFAKSNKNLQHSMRSIFLLFMYKMFTSIVCKNLPIMYWGFHDSDCSETGLLDSDTV
jgi:hypothetical protein